MADILNEARFREVCQAIFHDPTLIESIVTNTYTNIADYTLHEVDRIIAGGSHYFRVVDPLTGNIERMTDAIQKVGQGTFGEVFADHTKHRIYKIIRTTDTKQEQVFQGTIRETIIQVILQNITYPHHGKQIPCAPQIYGFYKYRSSNPGQTGFVIEMESMYQSADSAWALVNFPNTFYSFVNIIKVIKDQNILYNHCDVKLNNMMYDFEGNLRLIDFGFSSIRFTFQDTARNFEIVSGECEWYQKDVVAEPLHPAPSPPGYYLEKDVIHFLLTSWSAFGIQLQHSALPSFQFLQNLLRYYGLSDGVKTLLNVEKRRNNKSTFQWSYNFNTKTRRYLHKHRPNVLEKTNPNRILSEYLPMAYPPIKPHPIVILSGIKTAIETNSIITFMPLFSQLDNKDISFPGYPSAIQLTIEYVRFPFFSMALQHGSNPKQKLFQNIPLLLYVIVKLANNPEVHKFITLLLRKGVDIDQLAGPENIPILYFVLKISDSNLRNKILPLLLKYNPDLTYQTPDGKTAIDLAIDSGDMTTQQLIGDASTKAKTVTTTATATASAMPGGRRKGSKKHTQKKRHQKKQKKRQTRK